jgi:PadR family transcriptional regulator PadR
VTLREAVLWSLQSEDSYGLKLTRELEPLGLCKEGDQSVYPVLRGLEREGLASHYEKGEALEERGGRPRVYYKLTEKGQEAADELRKRILP